MATVAAFCGRVLCCKSAVQRVDSLRPFYYRCCRGHSDAVVFMVLVKYNWGFCQHVFICICGNSFCHHVVCVCVCVRACVHAHMRAHVCSFIFVPTHLVTIFSVCVCVCASVHACMRACVCVDVFQLWQLSSPIFAVAFRCMLYSTSSLSVPAVGHSRQWNLESSLMLLKKCEKKSQNIGLLKAARLTLAQASTVLVALFSLLRLPLFW